MYLIKICNNFSKFNSDFIVVSNFSVKGISNEFVEKLKIFDFFSTSEITS